MIGQVEKLIEIQNLRNEGRKYSLIPNVVAFTSGKGGTGKTFLSLNTAFALAKSGMRVLFIDMDINLSNASIMLNHIAEKTIYDFYTRKELFENVIVHYTENLDFVFGDSGKFDYPTIDSTSINYLFSQIRNIHGVYDVIIIDTCAGAGKDVVNLLLNTQTNIIVSTPEPTSIMDAYVMMKLLKHQNYAGNKQVIINKCEDETEASNAYDNLQSAASHFLGDKVNCIGWIDNNKLVSKAIIDQKIFISSNPIDQTSLHINKLAAKIYSLVQMANNNHSATI